MSNKIKTKYGNAYINSNGYYQIIGGNNKGKKLHRLIWENFYNITIPRGYDLHHINGDKLDNRIQNLQCVEHKTHVRFHALNEFEETKLKKIKSRKSRKGVHLSDEHKRSISESKKGHEVTTETKLKISKELSKHQNTNGYFRVYLYKSTNCKQGFIYRYQYYDENGKRKAIQSVDIDKLKEKVLAKGLEWIEY